MRKIKTTLFLIALSAIFTTAIGQYTPEEQAEIDAANNMQSSRPGSSYLVDPMMPTLTPNAGETQTFIVNGNELFTDPGGPGGDCEGSQGPGNYPNCDCITTTTLTSLTHQVILDFKTFGVFLTFDTLNIYDGPDTSSPLLYRSGVQGDELAEMITSNGSSIFVSTDQSLTVEFRASGVVDFCGWEAEVLRGDAIPTLSQWGILALAMLTMIFGVMMIRQRKSVLA